MRIDHLEMPLRHRQIDRFAHRAAGMMKAGKHVDKLHEILEILDRRVASLICQVTNKGWPVNRGEHHVVAADFDRAGRIARMLGEG